MGSKQFSKAAEEVAGESWDQEGRLQIKRSHIMKSPFQCFVEFEIHLQSHGVKSPEFETGES